MISNTECLIIMTADVAACAYSDYALTYSQLYKWLVTSSCYRCVSVFLLVVKKVIGLRKCMLLVVKSSFLLFTEWQFAFDSNSAEC